MPPFEEGELLKCQQFLDFKSNQDELIQSSSVESIENGPSSEEIGYESPANISNSEEEEKKETV